MHDRNDDLQNYDNNLDDKDNKDGKDYQEMSVGQQFGPVETELDILHRRDKGKSEEDFLHSDRNRQRRKASQGSRSDDNTKNPGMCAKGKDGRGVQRGECKGCKECFEFKGDTRCDYCNCAATQHTNLIHGSSNLDTTASTSKMGNVQDSKGKDGRGVQRGECKGCKECLEFKGDTRCDYCNCAATRHTNLIHGSSNLDTTASTSKMGNVQDSKGKDGRGVQRGECKGCKECFEFKGDARCDYCNCAATQHTNLIHGSSNLDTTASTSKMGNVQDSKGKDGRGVQRGECKGCKECFEFKGDTRCDYCNCAATQHTNLIHGASNLDTTASTSKMGNVQDSKGKDGRGVQRGECKGCKECFEFKGDTRCDYCNCAATQHTNLIHGSSNLDTTASTSKMGNVQDSKGKDGRGVQRGACKECNECFEFEGDTRCDYCNCAATQHTNLIHGSSNLDTNDSPFKMGNLQDRKQKYGRGVKGGKCLGCTECFEFRGDVRCDYCNCFATYHVNCTRPSSSVDTSRHFPRTSQPGIDSRGVKRERCVHCNDCSLFSGTDRCDYCNCSATQHIKLTEPSSTTDITMDFLYSGSTNKVDAFTKRFLCNWTQDHILKIHLRSHSGQLEGVSQTELQQRFNDSIQNKITQIERDVRDVFEAQFKNIRFENGCIIINMVMNQLERDAEIILRERREKIENYAKSLVKDIFPVQFMNLHWHRNLTLKIDMAGIFTSELTDPWQQSSTHEG